MDAQVAEEAPRDEFDEQLARVSAMSELEVMRGALTQAISQEQIDMETVVDVAVMTIRLTEIIEERNKEVDAAFENIVGILQMQTDQLAQLIILAAEDMSDHEDELMEARQRGYDQGRLDESELA